jgi:hypothetical protein
VRDETTGFLKLIWGKREGNYFCSGGWTGQIALIRFNKSQLSSDRRQSSVIALIAALSGALGDLSRPCSHRGPSSSAAAAQPNPGQDCLTALHTIHECS